MMKRTLLTLLAVMASVICFAAEPIVASDFVHITYLDENLEPIENPTNKEECARIPSISVDAAKMKSKGFTLVAGRWLREEAGGVIKVTNVEETESEDEEDEMTSKSMSITFPTKAMCNAFVTSLKKIGFTNNPWGGAGNLMLNGFNDTGAGAIIEGNTVILTQE